MSEAILTLKPDRIARMKFVYGDGKTAKAVKDKVGCDHIVNASFYASFLDEEGKPYKLPVFHLKNEGEVVKDPGYTTYGTSWKSSENGITNLNYGVKTVSNDQDNTWISGYRLIDPELDTDDPLDRSIPSYAVKRGRTLMGVKDDGTLVIYVCGDDTLHSLTAVQCRQKMLELGCKYAIMLDGGGSSQCDFATGDYIRSTRAVCDYLCIWEKEPEPEVEYKTFYRVQVGAFSKKENAENYRKTMVWMGYNDAYVRGIIQSNGSILYKVQIGSFSVYENAKNLEAKLEAAGINAFISTALVEV